MDVVTEPVLGVTNQYALNVDYVNRDFSSEQIERVLRFCSSHPSYGMTDLVSLPYLANHLHLKNIYVKDESRRFGLKAFKVMGALHGVAKYLAARVGQALADVSFDELKIAASASSIGELTFVSATDGNHGRAVAWAARELGHRAVIYMPKGTSQLRLNAVLAEGAHAEVTNLNYDDCVRLAKNRAEENGWIVVQDTAWDGYGEIPLWIMQGYAAIAREIEGQLTEKPTHVFLQAGVGSFAGAVAAYLTGSMRGSAPRISVVEPHHANCFFRSMSSGRYTTVNGDLDTVMVGLACGEPNPMAWDIVKNTATAAFSCADELTALGMRVLGNPLDGDPPIVSGESGAVTAGLLYHIAQLSGWREKLSLSSDSVVLLISTEGDTDMDRYREVVWKGRYPWPSTVAIEGVRI